MSDLKISIIVPCYNAENYLEYCLSSCLQQTYENCEVIFVDNESTDNSYNIACTLKEKYPQLTVETAPNIYRYSWTEPVEKALEIISGDYFTIVGADDILTLDYVSNVVKKIKFSGEEVLCLQSAIQSVPPDGSPRLIGYDYKNIEELKYKLLHHCCVNTPTVFYKTTLHKKKLLHWDSEKYLGAADYDLYCELADNNIMIVSYNEWLGYIYRLHSDQATWGMVSAKQVEGLDFDTKIKTKWSERWRDG